jgi:hypothetical protein
MITEADTSFDFPLNKPNTGASQKGTDTLIGYGYATVIKPQ